MPPCVYRGGITEDGTFRFYATVIDRIARADLRLCLYHFPDICGVPLTPTRHPPAGRGLSGQHRRREGQRR